MKPPVLSLSTLGRKGQTTVPAAVRAALGMRPGTRLRWHVMPDGTAIVRAKNRSVLELAGMLRPPKGKSCSLQEMNAWASSDAPTC